MTAPPKKDLIGQFYRGSDPEFYSDDDMSSEQWKP
jgi:hypothetical protein